MATKQSICYEVLKQHGLVITYSGKSLGYVSPEVKDEETFGEWKKRVLGPNVREVMVYAPVKPVSQTHISTVQNSAGGEHIKKIFEAFGRSKNKETKEAVSATIEEVYEQYSTIPKDTLRNVLESYDGILEPSLEEYFNRLLETKTEDVDAQTLFKDMLKGYNNAVRSFREQIGKHEG